MKREKLTCPTERPSNQAEVLPLLKVRSLMKVETSLLLRPAFFVCLVVLPTAQRTEQRGVFVGQTDG